MSLLVCSRCNQGIDSQKAIAGNGVYLCPKCKCALSYFGGESVTLSTPLEIEKYDQIHSRDVLSGFLGRKPVSYQNPEINVMILDCLDSLKHNPKNIDALYSLAKLYYAQGDLKRAKEIFQNILEVDSHIYEAHQNLANIYLYLKDYAKAITELEIIKSAEPENFLVFFNLGIVYYQKKDLELALEYFLASYKKCAVKKVQEKIYDYIFRVSDDLGRLPPERSS